MIIYIRMGERREREVNDSEMTDGTNVNMTIHSTKKLFLTVCTVATFS